MILVLAAVLMLLPIDGVAANEPADAVGYIERDGLDPGIRNFVAARMKERPSFKGTSPASCTQPVLTQPGYEGIPVMDCTYLDEGLNGWVRLAVIPADLMSDWILNAAKLCKQPKMCAAKLADDLWGSNNFSFPIAGNIIEPADSLGGGTGSEPTNVMFIHGVTVERPAVLPEHAVLGVELQKQCALALLASAGGLKAPPVAGDPAATCSTLKVIRQVSRPAAIRQDIYVDYGDPQKTRAQRLEEAGASCPAEARKIAWLDISRRALVDGWAARRHRLIDTAARAVDAGKQRLGYLGC